MSLKAFHVVFIVASTLLASGFGVWSLHHATNGGGTAYRVAAVVAFLTAGGLVIYGRWFLHEMKEVS